MSEPPEVLALGRSVLLSGSATRATADALLIALRHRKFNGLPISPLLADVTSTLLSVIGHADVPMSVHEAPCGSEPDMTIEEAAKVLQLSTRQTRRAAPQLGGVIRGGRWLLDRESVVERKDAQCR